MTYTEKKGTQGAFTTLSKEIVKDLVTSVEPRNMREDLREMMMAFLMYYPDPSQQFKEKLFCTYELLNEALLKMEQIDVREAAYDESFPNSNGRAA